MPDLLEKLNWSYENSIHSDKKELGYEFKKLEFGESAIYDFYIHGSDYRKLMSERKKEIGLYFPRSLRRYKMVDYGLELMENLERKTSEVLYLLYYSVLIFQLYNVKSYVIINILTGPRGTGTTRKKMLVVLDREQFLLYNCVVIISKNLSTTSIFSI